MKTFLIVAQTLDGFIAKDPGHTPLEWTSAEDKKFFAERTIKAGTIVLGENTYNTIGRPLPNRRNIVYTSKEQIEGVETTTEDPAALLQRLEQEGVLEAAVCGGSTVYTMFLKAGLIDTMYITLEPVVFGAGVSLFNEAVEARLELASSTPLNKRGSVLLEYNVIR